MFTLRWASVFLAFSCVFAGPTIASTLSFQPTSLSEPYFPPTVATGNVIPGSLIDLSAGGVVLLEDHDLPRPDVNGNSTIHYPVSSPFTLQGILKSSLGEPDIPITLTGNASGRFDTWSNQWAGGFSGTVTSVTFPTGTPVTEVQYLTSMLGDLSRIQIDGTVPDGGMWLPSSNPVYGVAAYLTINQADSHVPEPSVLAFMVLASSALALRRYLDRKSRKGDSHQIDKAGMS